MIKKKGSFARCRMSDRIYEFDKEKRQLCQVPESIEKEKEMER